MKYDLELIITDAGLERMQAEVDDALCALEVERIASVEEYPAQRKSA